MSIAQRVFVGVLAAVTTCVIATGAYADASITITDGATSTPILADTAKWSGVLNVHFDGRIAPHENTVIPLVNPEGKRHYFLPFCGTRAV